MTDAVPRRVYTRPFPGDSREAFTRRFIGLMNGLRSDGAHSSGDSYADADDPHRRCPSKKQRSRWGGLTSAYARFGLSCTRIRHLLSDRVSRTCRSATRRPQCRVALSKLMTDLALPMKVRPGIRQRWFTFHPPAVVAMAGDAPCGVALRPVCRVGRLTEWLCTGDDCRQLTATWDSEINPNVGVSLLPDLHRSGEGPQHRSRTREVTPGSRPGKSEPTRGEATEALTTFSRMPTQ
jgi:hypothetical protein